jgi:hypothetical protein
VYRGIDAAHKSSYALLLSSHDFLGEHLQQDTPTLKAVRRMKPIWMNVTTGLNMTVSFMALSLRLRWNFLVGLESSLMNIVIPAHVKPLIFFCTLLLPLRPIEMNQHKATTSGHHLPLQFPI